MLTLGLLTIRNFFSVGNITQTINLSANYLTLILGENVDAPDINNRNGTGKSTILQAICYALYGSPITNVTLDRLVNNQNEKQMLVTLAFSVHGKSYRVERGRKPNVLRFYIDGIDCALGENRHTQVDIERILGMSYLMFCHTVALSTFVDPYLELRLAEQREVIEELLMITKLTKQAISLKAQMDNTKDNTRDEQAKLDAHTEANQRIEAAIAAAKTTAKQWQDAHDRTLQALLQTAEQISDIDIDQELGIFDLQEQWQQRQMQHQQTIAALTQQANQTRETLKRSQADLARYQIEAKSNSKALVLGHLRQQITSLLHEAENDISGQLQTMAQDASAMRQDGDQHRERSVALQNDLDGLQRQLQAPHTQHCSTCGQGLSGTGHLQVVLDRLSEESVQVQCHIDRALSLASRDDERAAGLEQQMVTVQQAHHERCIMARTQVSELEQKMGDLQRDILAEQIASEEKITTISEFIAESTASMQQVQVDLQIAQTAAHAEGSYPKSRYADRSAVIHLRQERDRLFNQIENETHRCNPHTDTVKGLRGTLLVIDYARLNALITTAKHEQFLYKLLTNKDSFLRKRIIDQNLSLLNKRLNLYLEHLGLPHEVIFMADTTVAIHYMGKQMDYAQMSRGERNRIWLGNSWAFRDVWEAMNMPFNLVFADEVLDQGIDPAGVQAAVDLLSRMATDRRKNVFLISHKEELRERIEHTLLARRENRFTTFVPD